MDEITLDGKTYISSKKAAAITGYAKDYVGQLCREGRVEARLVGRSWYVYEPSLEAHRFEDGRKAPEKEASDDLVEIATAAFSGIRGLRHDSDSSVGEPSSDKENTVDSSDITNKYNVFSDVTYRSEAVEPLPIPEKELPVADQEITEAASTVEEKPKKDEERVADMQNAWQEWFSAPINMDTEQERPAFRQEEEPQQVPVRRVVTDIGPTIATEREGYVPVSMQREHIDTKKAEHKPRVGRSPQSYALIKASLVSVILITLTIAIVATGYIHELHISSIERNIFIEYFGGVTSIK